MFGAEQSAAGHGVPAPRRPSAATRAPRMTPPTTPAYHSTDHRDRPRSQLVPSAATSADMLFTFCDSSCPQPVQVPILPPTT